MNRITAVLMAAVACASAHVAEGATMGPGPVEFDEAAAVYNPFTGEIVISVNDIETWSIRSASSSMTGASALFPSVPGAVNSYSDMLIGQGVFSGAFTYFDHNFGPVAAMGLPLSDLTLEYYYAFN